MEYIFTHLLPYFIIGFGVGVITLTVLRHRHESPFMIHLALCPYYYILEVLCYLVPLYHVFGVADYTLTDKVFSTAGTIFLVLGVTTSLKRRRLK